MLPHEAPELVARNRVVTVEALLTNQVDLRAYPHRHIAVVSRLGIGVERVTPAIAAADLLDRHGWELVTVSELHNSRFVYAFFRRR
ncbi:hypothetical protein GCM10027290_20300 [Micromonospora sonneratiae]|uniref:Transcriptional regulator n=1 Tax=Micromonospora sonneratiae TaxID=1184706 RepID=A0ABW3YH60_9ACTN